MSRIDVIIDQIVMRGFEPADRRAVLEGLQTELSRVLADPVGKARSHNIPVLNLGRMPLSLGPAGGRNFGTRVGGAIGKGLKP